MPDIKLFYGIAGLLHDIGKFGQRADVSLDNSSYLSGTSKNLVGTVCRMTQKGYPTHQHVLWTNEFIERNISKFRNCGLDGDAGDNSMINLAVFHHKPATPEQAVITLADHWSSGLDRNTDRYLEPNPEYGKDKFRSMPLVSVFSKLATPEMPGGDSGHFGYPVQVFGRGDQVFPRPIEEINNRNLYGELWEAFESDFQRLPDGNAGNFLYSLYHLLKMYCWYIPASTMDYPDSSLFEHLKTTGAFASSFATYRAHNPAAFEFSNGRLRVHEGHYPLMLFCGDISGIQNFIYNISNKSAMKGLKGRSFYVQLLAETLSQEILDATGYSVINQVYAAGGKFYLLLPNVPEVVEKLEEYERNIQFRLWQQHKGGLSVNLAWQAFSMKQLGSQGKLSVVIPEEGDSVIDVGELWGLLAKKTSEKKHQRFKHVISERYQELFTASGVGGNTKVCAVSGEELIVDEMVSLERTDVEQSGDTRDEINVSEEVSQQISLGKRLYNARYLTQLMGYRESFIKVGLSSSWQLSEEFHPHSIQKWISIDWDNGVALIPEGFTPHVDSALGFRLYGGTRMARDASSGLLRTLEELCEDSGGSDENAERSGNMLGVLRMDVDNLGSLFMRGFKTKDDRGVETNQASFSALATLSSLFDQFFGGFINSIRNSSQFRDHVNVVYSGGDDVFAIGRWDMVLDFGIEVSKRFREFVCGRDDITLSGGLSIVRPKFPIAKAAELSAEMEDLAKVNAIFVDGLTYSKNSLSLFGIPLNWTHEVPFVIECRNDLVEWIHERGWISKGLLMKMFSYYETYLCGGHEWKWQASYALARLAKESRSNPDKKACIEYLRILLMTGNYKNKYQPVRFPAFIAACRLAELEIKRLKA